MKLRRYGSARLNRNDEQAGAGRNRNDEQARAGRNACEQEDADMEKILTRTVEAGEDGSRAGSLLKSAFGLSRREISRLKFQENGILADGVRIRVDTVLRAGQVLSVCLREKDTYCRLEETEGTLAVAYEDGDVLVADKPAGMPVHPCGVHERDSLANLVAAHYRDAGEESAVRPVGRLDIDTAGLVVFAKSRAAAARLFEQRREGVFRKTYLAWVEGKMEPLEGILEVPIKKIGNAPIRMAADAKGMPAKTAYRTIEVREEASLVEAKLFTGRTHQIRVHMAWAGHPLLGDPLYNPRYAGPAKEPPRAALLAWRLTFRQPFTGQTIRLDSGEISAFHNRTEIFRRH